jgi:hypothetical protein
MMRLGRIAVRRSPEQMYARSIGPPIERVTVAPISAALVVAAAVET